MCLSPIKVKNTWYCPFPLGSKERNEFEKRKPYWFLHDTTSFYINVPCGLCAECLQARQNELVQRCYMLSKYNYVLFGTLTYQNSMLPIVNINGYNIKFAYVKDFQNFIKRLRKYEILPSFRYVCFSEFGGDSDKHIYYNGHQHRPHFHFLFFIPFNKGDEIQKNDGYGYADKVLNFIPSKHGWYRNVSNSRSPIYIPISRFIRRYNNYTYDCQFVNNNSNKVVYYVTKYCLKFNDYVSRLQSALRLNLPDDEYKKYWSLIRPHFLSSNGVGINISDKTKLPFDDCIFNDLLDMFKYSLDNKSQYIQFFLGNKVVPMCKYFVDKCLIYEYSLNFHNLQHEGGIFEDSFYMKEIPFNDFRAECEKNLDKQKKFLNLCTRLNGQHY